MLTQLLFATALATLPWGTIGSCDTDTEKCFKFKVRGATGKESVQIIQRNRNTIKRSLSTAWRGISVYEAQVGIVVTNSGNGSAVEFAYKQNKVLGTTAYHGDTVFGEEPTYIPKWNEWQCDSATEADENCDTVKSGIFSLDGNYFIKFYSSFEDKPAPTPSPSPSPTSSPTPSPTAYPTASPIPAPTPSPTLWQPSLEWVHISEGMSWNADTGKLEKVSGKDWKEGVTGAELSFDGSSSRTISVTWQGDQDSHVMIGLTAGAADSDEDFKEIDCAMYMDKKKLKFYESGEKVSDEDLEYSADDVLGLSIDGSASVLFYKNGEHIASCSQVLKQNNYMTDGPFHLDASFKDSGKIAASVTFLGIEWSSR